MDLQIYRDLDHLLQLLVLRQKRQEADPLLDVLQGCIHELLHLRLADAFVEHFQFSLLALQLDTIRP